MSEIAKKYDEGRLLETPQPSAKSGMRFDELYRLKGVVSVHTPLHRSSSVPVWLILDVLLISTVCHLLPLARHRSFLYGPRRVPQIQRRHFLRCQVRKPQEAFRRGRSSVAR
jgi:hypothetical protein